MTKAAKATARRRKHLPVDQAGPKKPSEARADTTLGLLVDPPQGWFGRNCLAGCIAFAAVLIFAYWPTLVWMEDAWRREPDYSHGYLVPFLALLLCWNRWDQMPGIRLGASWGGVVLIAIAIAMRFASRVIYADFLDAWSLLPLLAGFVWLMFGYPAMRWAAPAIAFLFFMIPLPYQAESLLSWKLQGVATDLSTVMLRVFGQPAVNEGHVIWINDLKLQVEEACSGLRIFIGVAALAFFWAAMVQRGWLDRVIILLSVVPLAVFVNSLRITVVGVLYRIIDDPASQSTIHDISGYLMIPLAFGLLWLVKLYWERLYRPVEQLTAMDFVPGEASRGSV